jgi:hypothetical protein
VWSLAAQHALCAVVPVLFTVWFCAYSISRHSFAVDFDHAFWPAGHRVLEGQSPFAAPGSLAARNGVAFVYPAVGALFFAAFAWIPRDVAEVLFTLASLAAALGALRILGVRDWRLYGLTALWPPVASGWQTANVTLLFVLGIALAWRWRDKPVASGAVIAVIVSLKLFLWPLGVWLIASRRWATVGLAVAIGVVINVLAWAVLGFDQVHAYVDLARAVSKVEEATAYTPLALALHLGTTRLVAYAVELAIAGGVAVLCLRSGRRGKESSALVLAIVLSLLATPTVWRHYFALLLVPLAISRPRLSPLWVLPLLTFVCPVTAPKFWELCLTLGSMSLVVVALLVRPFPPEESRRRPGFVRVRARAGLEPAMTSVWGRARA